MNRLPPSVEFFFSDAKPVWPKARYDGPALDNIDQISILVQNVDEAIEYYGAAFGWGPFYLGRVRNTLPYKGRLSEFEVKLAFVLVGNLEIELVEVVDGDTPFRDQLLEKGEGIQHLRLTTGDMEAALDHLASLGIEPIFGYRPDDRWVNVYINSHKCHGVRVELMRTYKQLAEDRDDGDSSWRREV